MQEAGAGAPQIFPRRSAHTPESRCVRGVTIAIFSGDLRSFLRRFSIFFDDFWGPGPTFCGLRGRGGDGRSFFDDLGSSFGALWAHLVHHWAAMWTPLTSFSEPRRHF